MFHGVVWFQLKKCNLFCLKSSNGFSVKGMISKGPSCFVLFVYNDGAFNLHLHVVALPASVTLSCPTKST